MEAQVQPKFDYNKALDAVEYLMHQYGTVDIPHSGVFTPGLYTRSGIIPPNTYLLSYIHKQKHQFLMSAGDIVIYTEDEGMVFIHGPYLGITYEGTRRFAKTLSQVVWTSIHSTNIQPIDDSDEALEEAEMLVEAELFEDRVNIFLIKAQEDEKWESTLQ